MRISNNSPHIFPPDLINYRRNNFIARDSCHGNAGAVLHFSPKYRFAIESDPPSLVDLFVSKYPATPRDRITMDEEK